MSGFRRLQSGVAKQMGSATQPDVFDFDIVSDNALRDFLETNKPNLQPIFTNDFMRTASCVRRGPWSAPGGGSSWPLISARSVAVQRGDLMTYSASFVRS